MWFALSLTAFPCKSYHLFPHFVTFSQDQASLNKPTPTITITKITKTTTVHLHLQNLGLVQGKAGRPFRVQQIVQSGFVIDARIWPHIPPFKTLLYGNVIKYH